MLVRAFVFAMLLTAFMCICIYLDLFKKVTTDLGFEHYAEIPSMTSFVPRWLKMPWNTIINIGYVMVGAVWMANTSISWESKALSDLDAFLFYFFNWLAIFYGPIQCLRIITQLHEFAVLDQWVTLPFFMWVVLWSRYILFGWDRLTTFLVMAASVLSYGLTLVHHQGFEAALGCHMLLAIISGLAAYNKYRNSESRTAIFGALSMCTGFVGLKLLDLYLPGVHSIFTYISGHFLSKICDFMQIYYMNNFFLGLVKAKRIAGKKMQ